MRRSATNWGRASSAATLGSIAGPNRRRGNTLTARELYTARLRRKVLLSASAACYHLEFTFEDPAPPRLEAGQFLSLIADDPLGKTYTRAYSLASSPSGPSLPPGFDLCVNRVAGGFFSNLLCDMREGDVVQCHGPHGLFTLKQPPADCLLIAAGTGIAPMRGFTQQLFPEAAEGPGRSTEQECWLVYEAPTPDELFYDRYFRELAARQANFHYRPVFGSENHKKLEEELAQVTPGAITDSTTNKKNPADPFCRYAYVCGLGEFVKPTRTKLLELGWQKRQVLFERYD